MGEKWDVWSTPKTVVLRENREVRNLDDGEVRFWEVVVPYFDKRTSEVC